jgi:hypothetical protein
MIPLSSGRLDHHGGAVAEDFGRGGCAAHFRGVVPQTDHGVGAKLYGVLDQQIVGLLPGLFAHLGVGADVAADDVFQLEAGTIAMPSAAAALFSVASRLASGHPVRRASSR